jgi:hypothetical protein
MTPGSGWRTCYRAGDRLSLWSDDRPDYLWGVALTSGETPDVALQNNSTTGRWRAGDSVATRVIDEPDSRAGDLIIAGPSRPFAMVPR